MPREVHPPPKKPNPKGKPMGIPLWGWIAGAVLGIIIGYILLKNRGSSAGDSGTSSSPLAGDQSSGSGGGVVASPPPASPLDSAGINQQPVVDNTEGDQTSPSQDYIAATTPSNPFQVAPNNPAFFAQGTSVAEPESFQPLGAGGYAVQTALASGSVVAASTVPSIIANPQPPTGNISPYSPNLPRHALNIAAG